MQLTHSNTLDALRSVVGFLDAKAAALGIVAAFEVDKSTTAGTRSVARRSRTARKPRMYLIDCRTRSRF